MKICSRGMTFFVLFIVVISGCAPIRLPYETPASPTHEPTHALNFIEITNTPLATSRVSTPWDLVADLYERDRDCQLPCSWNIVLGQTQWIKVKDFLSKYGASFRENGELVSGTNIIGVTIPYKRENRGIELYQDQAYFLDVDEIVQSAALVIPDFDNSHTFQKFIISYGQPDQVWVSTYNDSYQGNLPFKIALIYNNQNFLALISSGNTFWDETSVTGCFQNPVQVILYAWNRQYEWDFSFLNAYFLSSRNFLKIEEVTQTTTQEFFDDAAQLNNPVCISTPKELWSNIK